jgi:hypothetical protein
MSLFEHFFFFKVFSLYICKQGSGSGSASSDKENPDPYLHQCVADSQHWFEAVRSNIVGQKVVISILDYFTFVIPFYVGSRSISGSKLHAASDSGSAEAKISSSTNKVKVG